MAFLLIVPGMPANPDGGPPNPDFTCIEFGNEDIRFVLASEGISVSVFQEGALTKFIVLDVVNGGGTYKLVFRRLLGANYSANVQVEFVRQQINLSFGLDTGVYAFKLVVDTPTEVVDDNDDFNSILVNQAIMQSPAQPPASSAPASRTDSAGFKFKRSCP
jgi:hypothetical protein